MSHVCGPAQWWKEPKGKVPEAPRVCPGGVGRRGQWEGVGEGAAQGLEEGGGQLPTQSPHRPTGEPAPQHSHTHPRASHVHTLSQARTHTHTRDTHTCHTHACTPTPSLTHTHTYRLAHTHIRGVRALREPPAPSTCPSIPGVGRRGSWAPSRAPRRGPQIRGLCKGSRWGWNLDPRGPAPCPATSSLRMDPWARRCPGLFHSHPWVPGLRWGRRAGGHSPMKDTALGLMMPLGSRWKSYSLPSTTTVWPALLPPWGQKPDRHLPQEACLAPSSLG